MEPILLYDTTLRDGSQGENISFTVAEKMAVACRLDDFGIHYIEGGWPGSNPKDMAFFEMAAKTKFHTARLTAFGSTRKPGIHPKSDENLRSLLAAGTPAITIFGKSWDLHVKEIVNTTLEENLAMIRETVSFLKDQGREVIYDAEHFFDGYRENPEYALETLKAAADAGAQFLVLCDTNGGNLSFDIEASVQKVQCFFADRPVRLGIHTHNDCGLAVANSITAIRAGAIMVQGTMNGYGERCGNADLTSIIPILCLKMNRPCITPEKLKNLKPISRFISESANMIPLNSRPFVGRSAFAHKGGVHVSAIMKMARAYEHIDPEAVGNKRRVLISDLAGKSNVEYKAREMDVEIGGNGFDSRKIADEIKSLEKEGYQFDLADGSFKILVQKITRQFMPLFELKSFRVAVEKDEDRPCSAHATIKISVGGNEEITAAEGCGPVSALDNALRKALGKFYPDLDSMHLVDFKVRVIDGREGTAARVRVSIESRDQDHIWNTIGVSEDIIEASWQALADSFQYKLSQEKTQKPENHNHEV